MPTGYPYYNNLSYYGGLPTPYMGMVQNPPTAPPYQPPYTAQGQPPLQPVQQTAPASGIPPQTMTPPTVRAEIIQVRNIEEAERFPVNAGTSQLFQLADDSAFIIKTVLANGESDLDIYAKQPKKPAAPSLDLSGYVTREELEERLAGLVSGGRKRREKQEPIEPTGTTED